MDGIPEHERGNPCYIMVGDNLMYDPSHLESKSYKRDLDALNSYSVDVSVRAAISRRSLTQLKKHRISQRCISNLSSRQNMLDQEKDSPNLHKSIAEGKDREELYNIRDLPIEVKMENPFFKYASNTDLSNGKLSMTQTMGTMTCA